MTALGIFLAALAPGAAPAAPPPERPVSVSLVRLIADPAAFDGKLVRVIGFVRIEHEDTAVYLHRDDDENLITKNGLWLAVNDGIAEGSKEAAANGRYALVEGRFRAKEKGHLGLWSGSIKEVTRLEAWSVRRKK
ncbi:MAG: hypothetical protein K2W96_08310 [Gemmataceae bacterium]|nr:hypothetical protein [Gemmataceae bacterium]